MKRVAILGCGDISARYAAAIVASPRLELSVVASRSAASAESLARRFGAECCAAEALFDRRDIDWLVNLTPPLVHAQSTRAALQVGFSVYSEKPLAGTTAEADDLITLAERQGVALACAPATFLGPSLQTARALLDAGEIGRPLGAAATMIYPGPDLWHHSPAALFGPAAGPIYDMGVYDITALAHLFGPVEAVSAAGGRARATRRVERGPRAGETFPVSEPTHAAVLIEFASGAVATATLSFDGFGSAAPGLEVYGDAGTLVLPRASLFDGEMRRSGAFGEWRPLPSRFAGWSDDLWIIGLLEAIEAADAQAPPRTQAALARHVLEVLQAITDSVRSGGRREIGSTLERPRPMRAGDYDRLRGVHELETDR